MSLVKAIIDAVTGNVTNDVLEAVKRRAASSDIGRAIEHRLNPDQLHETTRIILSESLAEVLSNFDSSDLEQWKAVLAHPDNRQQMVRWVLEWEEQAVPDLGDWSLENAPNPDMLRGLLRQLHVTIQEKKRKRFPPDFFNLQKGQQNILAKIEESSAQTAHLLAERSVQEPTGGHHREIDAAANYLKEGKPETALDLLEKLETDALGQMTAREKYRVRANIGHAQRLLGRPKEAAESYLVAKQYQPDVEDARWLESMAYSLRGETARSHDLADALRKDFPEFKRATSAWVASASAEQAFCDIESGVPQRHREDPEVASNLAQQAAVRHEWEVAEFYARSAAKEEPGWVEPRFQLAAILLGKHLNEARRTGAICPKGEQRDRMQESAKLFADGIADLPRHATDSEVARVKVELAMVYQLLGKPDKAAETILAAHELAPEDPNVRYAYAMHLIDSGKGDKAIDLLTAVSLRNMRESFLLAQALGTRNQGDDRNVAVSLLALDDDEVQDAEDLESHQVRVEWVRLLIRLHLDKDDGKAAETVLAGPMGGWLSPEDRLVFEAGAALANGDETSASAITEQATTAITTGTEACTVRELALVLYRMARFPESLELWRRIVCPDMVSVDSDYLMDCAQRSGREDVILEVCSKLRSSGVYERRYLIGELSILGEISPHEALDVLVDLQEAPLAEALKRELLAWQSSLAIRLGRLHMVDAEPAHLPQVQEIEYARTGRAVVEVLREAGLSIEAVQYAYELFRRFPDQLDAHMAVVSSVFLGHPQLSKPEAIEAGCAVLYKEDDTGREVWVVIEDADEPKSILGEQSACSSLGQVMLELKQGEQFLLRKRPQRTATVQRVVSKYVYRAQRCADEMESTFPGSAPLISLHIPTKEDGTPDVEVALEQIAEVCGDSSEPERLYAQQPVPLHMLGRHLACCDFEAVQQVACRSDMMLHCCVGVRGEREAAFASMNTATVWVVDPTALGTLYLLQTEADLNVQELFQAIPAELIVSEHTLLMLKGVLQSRLSGEEGRLSVTVTRGCPSVHRDSGEDVQRTRQAIEELIGAIETSCLMASGRDLATTGGDDKKIKDDATSMFGKAGLHSVLLAREATHVLWADDLACAVILCSGLGIRRTWSQAILFWMADRRLIPRDAEREATLILLLARYAFTSVRPDHIMLAGEKVGWQIDTPRLQPIWRHFGNAAIELPSRFRLASAVLKEVWQTDRLSLRAQTITCRMLEALNSAQGGYKVIESLLQNAEAIFGVDVVNAAAFRQTASEWLSREPRIILP